MLPHNFAGLGMNRPARIAAGHGPADRSALHLRSRTRPARSVIDEIKIGIVGEMAPDSGHPALLVWRAAPRLVPRLAGLRDHLIAPQLLAVSDVVTGDVAAKPGDLAGAARNDHAVGHDRAARILDEEVTAAIALPHPLAGAGVQAHDEIVPCGKDDEIAVER